MLVTTDVHVQMIDGVRVAARDERAVMTQLVSLWKKAQHGDTSPLRVAELCPACPGKVGTRRGRQMCWLLYLGYVVTSLTYKMAQSINRQEYGHLINHMSWS